MADSDRPSRSAGTSHVPGGYLIPAICFLLLSVMWSLGDGQPLGGTPAASSAAPACVPPSRGLGNSLAAGPGVAPTWPSMSPPSSGVRRRLPERAEVNALLQERATLLDRRVELDHQLAEARTHVDSLGLTWGGRGAGRRPLFLADCGSQGAARPAAGASSVWVLPRDEGVGLQAGQVLHARCDGSWRPAEVLQRCPNPQFILVRWWHDSSLTVLPVADTVRTLDRAALTRELVGTSGEGAPVSGQRPLPPFATGGPSLAVGQSVFAQYGGAWYPGRVRRLLPDTGEIQVLWEGDYSKTNLPISAVCPVPDLFSGAASSSGGQAPCDAVEGVGPGRWPPWAQVAAALEAVQGPSEPVESLCFMDVSASVAPVLGRTSLSASGGQTPERDSPEADREFE